MWTFRLAAAAILALSGLILPPNQPLPQERSVKITIRDEGVLVDATVPASVATVGEALAASDISTDEALVAPGPEAPLRSGMEITILRPHAVTLRDGSESPRTLSSFATTVGAALYDAEVSLGTLDRVAPRPTQIIMPDMRITITRITEEERTTTTAIPFPISFTNDPDLPYGRERVIRTGKEGSAEEVVRVRTENGQIVRRTVLERTIRDEPVAEQRVRGTKLTIGDVDEGAGVWGYYVGCNCAASNKYPRGTFVRVTNRENGRSVIVRINDYYDPRVDPYYNPAVPRIIDLDAPAFRQLSPLWKGVVPVRVEEIVSE